MQIERDDLIPDSIGITVKRRGCHEKTFNAFFHGAF